MKTDCQTGKTTQQLINAPKDSFFVWCNSDFHYPKQLCSKLNRPDIRLIGPSDIAYTIRGLRVPVIIDHYAYHLVSDSDLDFIKVHNHKAGHNGN